MRCVNIGNASLSRLFIIVTIFNARLSLRKKPGPNIKPASSSIAAQLRKVPSLVVICCYLDISSWVRSSLILWQSENDVKTWMATNKVDRATFVSFHSSFIHYFLSIVIGLFSMTKTNYQCTATRPIVGVGV